MNLSDIQRAYERVVCQVLIPGTSEETRVVFRSLSPTEAVEFFRSLRDESLTVYDHVARAVTAMPDLTDEGRPVKLTREVLDRFDVFAARALLETFIGLHTYRRTDPARGWFATAPLVKGEPCGLVEEWRGED